MTGIPIYKQQNPLLEIDTVEFTILNDRPIPHY